MTRLDPTTVLFENATARITAEAGGYLRFQEQAGPRNPALHQYALNELLSALEYTSLRRILIDRRPAQPYDEPLRGWVIGDWLPRLAARFPQHRAANLLVQDVFSRLSVVPIVAKAYHLGFPHQTFDNEAEAVAWLLH